jgi:hypothetical protein
MSHNNVHVLKQVNALVNMDNVRSGMQTSDLQQLEKMMLTNGMISHKVKDPQDKFSEDLANAAKRMGISFGDMKNEHSESSTSEEEYTEDGGDDGFSGNTLGYSGYNTEESTNSHLSVNDNNRYDIRSNVSSQGFNSRDNSRDNSQGVGTNYNGYSTVTQEQHRRAHIDSVIGNSSIDGFSIEKEKQEDLKCAMLAEIDMLLCALESEDVDISRIPVVDTATDYAKVETVLKMLRHKSDHTQYCRFANEFLMFGSYAMEDLFNGERTFGKYKPDLTGWSNVVNVKLRRMRVDTGQLVSSFMQDNKIGPWARLLLELVPSAFMHSRTRSLAASDPMLSSDDTRKSIDALDAM